MIKLAIITSHPVQYYAPWFRHIAKTVDLRVFYLWDFGANAQTDPGFGETFSWDIPLCDGYAHEFVPNISSEPGTYGFWGLRNPGLLERVKNFEPHAAMMIGYNHASMMSFLLRRGSLPVLFRGDSHFLAGEPAGLAGKIKLVLRSAIYSRMSAFLPVGQANAKYFASHGVPASRMILSPHAVDNERFSACSTEAAALAFRREWDIPGDSLLVMFCGKFEEKKRPLDLLEAWSKIDCPDGTLVFVGSGNLAPELRAAANKCRHRVVFAGFVNQTQMPGALGAADLLVLPSFGPSETWGLVVNEAMACGVPAIVSSHVGCGPDLIQENRTGWTFPAGSVEELGRLLQNAVNDRASLHAMGANARRLVQENFCYPKATESLVKALQLIVQ